MKTADPLKHLSRDKILAAVIKKVELGKLKHETDLYVSLLKAIVGQQLSLKAANTIWGRFLALFPGQYPSAAEVLNMDVELLRGAGLSYQKAGYIKNIAQFSITHTLDYRQLKKMDDEELISYLVQIKGVGRWTVEMILMFSLGRPDVFPKDDLGICQGIQKLYNIRTSDKRKLFKRMDLVADQWKPYRSLACMYIWRSRDLKVAP